MQLKISFHTQIMIFKHLSNKRNIKISTRIFLRFSKVTIQENLKKKILDFLIPFIETISKNHVLLIVKLWHIEI